MRFDHTGMEIPPGYVRAPRTRTRANATAKPTTKPSAARTPTMTRRTKPAPLGKRVDDARVALGIDHEEDPELRARVELVKEALRHRRP